MRKTRHGLLGALLFSCACALAGTARAELAVIANPHVKLVGISTQELKDLYLGRARTLPDGSAVELFDQPADSAAYAQFARDVLGLDVQALKSYRAKLMFTGKARLPQVFDTDEAVKRAVAGNPRGLGYVQGRHVDASVKVLLILP
ncbi:MAG: hypothetical protein M0R77_16360 [Gammaproteobacteria bacterium]|nr:hypothetical protein [Gammaproteobacteria bacterium]